MGGPPDVRLQRFELLAGDESAGFATERPRGDPPTRKHSA
jgi:hypothetical protein